jgi:hypothetical protein
MTASMDGTPVPMIDPEFRPDCTVRYDEWAGCGVNVQRRTDRQHPYVDLTFLTRRGDAESHYLTLAQIEQLRAALDAVTRTDPPPHPSDYSAGEEALYIAEHPSPVEHDGSDSA